MRIGFVGLGRMGTPMARNLARAGHTMTLWTRSQSKAEALAKELGCRRAETPAAVAEASEVVVTMLADDGASEAVHLAPDGLFSATGADVFLEMGTMSPAHIAALAANAGPRRRLIDAPVSGATQAAAEATLMIMLGGTEEEAEALRPILDVLGNRVICLGQRGAGSVMKLAVNSLIHGLNQNLAEAMVLAEAAGIVPERAFDAIEASAAAAPMLRYRRPLYLDEADNPVTFTLALARKDMDVTVALADELGVSLPQGKVVLEKLREAEAAGFGPRDMAAMLGFMREERR